MIVDSSVVVAVVSAEPDYRQYVAALQRQGRSRMSAGSYLETAIVLDRRWPALGRAFDEFRLTYGVEVVAVTPEQARIARQAYRDFGKGSGHPAQLNFGDCFAYALAVDSGEPLLFKGDDFGHTDVRSAL